MLVYLILVNAHRADAVAAAAVAALTKWWTELVEGGGGVLPVCRPSVSV